MFKRLSSLILTVLLAIPATAQNTPGAATPVTLAGCVQKSGDVYTITDDSSKKVFQLRGNNLRKDRHVEVTGTPGSGGVLDVTSLKQVGGSCRVSASGSNRRAVVVSALTIGAVATVAAIFTIRRQGEAR